MSNQGSVTDKTAASDGTSPPVWFWLVAGIALLWFLMDSSAFYMRVAMSDEFLNSMPENQRHLYTNMPIWVNVVFAAEVAGGSLGCAGLLLRKRWALPLFIVSIAGVLSQTVYVYFLSDAISTMGAPVIVMPLVAIVIGAGMIVVTRTAIARGWLR